MIDGKTIRYLIVGVVNTVIGYGLIVLLQYGAGLPPLAANAGGYLVGWAASYLLNRSYTFRSQRSHREGLPAYAAAAMACYALNAAVLHLALSWLKLPGALAQACGVAAYTVSFYLVNRYAIFKHRSC
jgi:putative flippase GtrA